MHQPTPLARSRAHVALTRAFDNRDSAGLAQALALYAGQPELPIILLAADFLDNELLGEARPIDLLSLQHATGLDREAAETVCLMVGARQRGFRNWTTAKQGYPEGAPLIVSKADFLEFVNEEICP